MDAPTRQPVKILVQRRGVTVAVKIVGVVVEVCVIQVVVVLKDRRRGLRSVACGAIPWAESIGGSELCGGSSK